jgi:hypothetical protein
MRTALAAGLAAMLFAASSFAQLYKWVDKDGRTRYSDRPPVGIEATPLSRPPAPASAPAAPGSAAASPAASDAAKDARKGPLTPAEQEIEFRRRIKEAQEAAAKGEQAKREEEERKENCARARESLATLESGQRIARTDSKGERFYVDDAQRVQETAKARDAVASWCK